MNKLDIFPSHLSSTCGPSNWCCDAETAPCSDHNSSASPQTIPLARKVPAKQGGEEVNQLIITGALSNAIGQLLRLLKTLTHSSGMYHSKD